MGVIVDLTKQLYLDHQARFSCADPAKVHAGVRAATAGPLHASVTRYGGFDYHIQTRPPPEEFMAAIVLSGDGELRAGRERLSFSRGDVLMSPSYPPSYDGDMHDCSFGLLRVPQRVVGELAEELTGLPAAKLRFEGITPASAAARALWSGTTAYIYRQLVSSGITKISALILPEMTRLAAAALLETFPNTTMTASYIRGPGQPAAPAALRRAVAHIDAHADQPVSVAEIAAAAGVTARALQYAFRRHYDATPMDYLRQVRLERAHRELQAADPTRGATVAQIARCWGWANAAHFAAAYRRRYGLSPSHTVRT
jgi:AraC-like DNA-binding protein